MRKRRTFFESLETRNLLTSHCDWIVDDVVEVPQNATQHPIDLLGNDIFPANYSGNRKITNVNIDYRERDNAGQIEIAQDGKSALYTADRFYVGTKSFSYQVDLSCSAQLHINIVSPLQPDEFQLVPDKETHTLDVLANDTFDPSLGVGPLITDVTVNGPGRAAISADGHALLYTPPEGFFGEAELSYFVGDVDFGTKVKIDLVDPLDREGDFVRTIEFGSPFTVDVIANDPFWEGYDGERKITELLDVREGSAAELLPDGRSIRFFPGSAPEGSGGVSYVIDGRFKAELPVGIGSPVNYDAYDVDQNAEDIELEVLRNDYLSLGTFRDREYVVSRLTSVTEPDQGGQVTISPNGISVLYTPARDFIGYEHFRYAADGLYETHVSVEVRDPYANVGRDDWIHNGVKEGHGLQPIDVLANDFFYSAQDYPGPRKITSVRDVDLESANVQIASDGTQLLLEPLNSSPFHRFSYTVDGKYTADVSVSQELVAGQYLQDFLITGPTPMTIDLSDEIQLPPNYAGPGLITSVTQEDPVGVATIGSDQKSIDYTPGLGREEIDYVVDGQFKNTITATPAPWASNDEVTIEQDESVSVDVLANDFTNTSYNGPRQITSAISRSGNLDVVVSNGRVEVGSTPGVVGYEIIDYVVDEVFQSQVGINILGLVANDQFSYPTVSVGTIELNVLQNDGIANEYDGPKLITGVTQSTAGSFVSITDGGKAILYQPAAGFRGIDRFSYVVDGEHSAFVDVHVDPVVESLFPNLSSREDVQEIVLQRGQETRHYTLSDFLPRTEYAGHGIHSEIRQNEQATFLATENQVIVVNTDNASLEVLSQVPHTDDFANFFVTNDLLAVVTTASETVDYINADRISNPVWQSEQLATHITIYDVSNPRSVEQVRRFELEGSYLHSSINDGVVHFVLRNAEEIESQIFMSECEVVNGVNTCGFPDRITSRIENQFGAIYQDLLPQLATFDERDQLVKSVLPLPGDFIDPRAKPGEVDEIIMSLALDLNEPIPDIVATNVILTTATARVLPSDDGPEFYTFEELVDIKEPDSFSWPKEELNQRTLISKYRFNPTASMTQLVGTTEVAGVVQGIPSEIDGLLHVSTAAQENTFGEDTAYRILRESQGAIEEISVTRNLLEQHQFATDFDGKRMLVKATTSQGIEQIKVLDFEDPASPSSYQFDTPQPTINWNSRYSTSSPTIAWIDESHIAVLHATWVNNISARITTPIILDVSDPTQPQRVYEGTFVSGDDSWRLKMRTEISEQLPHLDASRLFPNHLESNALHPDPIFAIDGDTLHQRDVHSFESIRAVPLDSIPVLPPFRDPIDASLHPLQDQAIAMASTQFGVTADQITVVQIDRTESEIRTTLLINGSLETITLPHVETEISGSIEGFVYLDANDNGILEDSEAPIPGTTILLTGSDWLGNALPSKTAITDFHGRYQFDVSEYGDYTITQMQPRGYEDGQETPDKFYSIENDDDTISRRIFAASIELGEGSETTNSTENNFGEQAFDATVPTLPNDFSFDEFHTFTFPTLLGTKQTIYRLPVPEHGAKLKLDGDAIFYVFNAYGEVVTMRDGSGFLAGEGHDVADTSEIVEFIATGEAKDYYVSFFPKPGSFVINDLAIDLQTPTTDQLPTIQRDEQTIILVGTIGDDVIDVQMGDLEHVVKINEITYKFASWDVREIHIGGAQGNDHVTVRGSEWWEYGSVIGSRSSLHSFNHEVFTYSMEKTTMIAGNEFDRMKVYGSSGDDRLESFVDGETKLTTPTHEYVVSGYERVDTYGRGGNDIAWLYGSDRNDTFAANNDHAWLRSEDNLTYAKGFERVNGFGKGGNDRAYFYASSTRNRFVSTPDYASLTDEVVLNVARGFKSVRFEGKNANDDAYIYGANSHFVLRQLPVVDADVERTDRLELIFGLDDLFVDGILIATTI